MLGMGQEVTLSWGLAEQVGAEQLGEGSRGLGIG